MRACAWQTSPNSRTPGEVAPPGLESWGAAAAKGRPIPSGETSVDIRATPASVFALLENVERSGKWQDGVETARKLSTGPTVRGSRFQLVRRLMGRLVGGEFEVSEYRPGAALSFAGGPADASYSADYRLEALAGGTRLKFSWDVTIKGLGPAAFMVGGAIKRQAAADLAKLKILAES